MSTIPDDLLINAPDEVRMEPPLNSFIHMPLFLS